MKVIRYRLTARAPWITPLQRFVEALQPGGSALVYVMRRVLIFGILRSVRKVFLSQQQKAFDIQVKHRGTLSERREATHAAAVFKRKLSDAYAALDKAVVSGSGARIKRAQAQLRRVEERIERVSKADLTKDRNERESRLAALSGRLRLGTIVGAMMRQRVLEVLEYLTSPVYVDDHIVSANTTTIGTAPRELLDLKETPTASVLLTGRRSSSKYKTLWRHLEFGTGIDAVPAAVQARAAGATPTGSGRFKNLDGSWQYGRQGMTSSGGLTVLGTKPMNFLWTMKGKPLALHEEAARLEFFNVMDTMTPRLR